MSTPAPSLTPEEQEPEPVKPVKKVILTKPYEIAGRERVFVIPATVHLRGENPPKTIEWENQTGGLVKIWLPNADAYLNHGNGRDFSQPIDVADGKSIHFTVKDRFKDEVDWKEVEFYYHYNVYCESIKNYAQGDSEPGMSCP
jgi:hypothetical protein